MRAQLHPSIERARVLEGPLASPAGNGLEGAFIIPGPRGDRLVVVVSDGRRWVECDLWPPSWEHVSAHVNGRRRCPTWEEMCFLKDQFWTADECVIQYHPPDLLRVNTHEHTLHLWRPRGIDLPMPPRICV